MSRGLAITRRLRALRAEGPAFLVRKRLWELEDLWWDRRRGISTRAMLGPDEVELAGPNEVHASRPLVRDRHVVYATPRIGHLRRVLEAIPADRPRHLVDYGAGLGRVLIAAREAGYASAVGVELSGSLCARARRLLDDYARRRPDTATGTEIVCADAVDYEIRPEQNVFYFYNPFGPAVLEPVLDAVEASVRSRPRPAWVLYVNRVHDDVLARRPGLRFVADLTSQRYATSLYEVCPPAG